MKNKEEIMNKIEEITDSNYSKFKGINEAELHSRFEIADWVLEQCQSDSKPIDLDELREEFEFAFVSPLDIEGVLPKNRLDAIFDWLIPHLQKQNESDNVKNFYDFATYLKVNHEYESIRVGINVSRLEDLYKEFLKCK